MLAASGIRVWRPTAEIKFQRGLVEWTVVLGWCLGALLPQGFIRSLTPFTFGSIFASDAASAFYSVAMKHDTAAILGHFATLREGWPLHAQSNLPGKILLVRALMHLTTRPDALAWIVVGISNLGGAPLYLFVRDFFADRRIALFSLVLYLFVPAKLFFFPLLNTVTPVMVFTCLYLVQRWLTTGRAVYAGVLGTFLYGFVLFEPLPLVIGLLCSALAARVVARNQMDTRMLLRHIGIGIIAFGVTYLAVMLAFGFNLVSAFRIVAAHATAFNIHAARPYSIWIRQNVIDFLFGAGICQIVVFGPALVDGLISTAARDRFTDPFIILSLALLAMLISIDLIGVNRGEVIRLWIFLACLFQIPAAYMCTRLNSGPAFTLVLATTLLQDVLGASMIGFIGP